MNDKDTFQGTVMRSNVIQYSGRQVHCWKNSMPAAVVPEPLDLSEYEGKVVELIGRLHGDLWEAEFVKVVLEDGYQVITGKVTGINVIEGPTGSIFCYRHGMVEARYMILNLLKYFGQTIQVSGDLHGNELSHGSVVRGPEKTIDIDPDKEARSLNRRNSHGKMGRIA